MNRPILLALMAMVLGVGRAPALAQTQAVRLPVGVQDVVKLAHGGIGDEVILAHLRSVGATYKLSADQILYLRDQGVSQAVIKALLADGGVPVPGNAAPSTPVPVAPTLNAAPLAAAPAAPPPVVSAPAPAPVDFNYFHDQLAPYGTWVQVSGYGWCWRPAVVVADPWWRPYCDHGYWTYADAGWCWQTDYAWGRWVFHYGRWYRSDLGWVWVPGCDWAPAWVCWRQAEGYCGWAPLPPGAVFRAGVGLMYEGRVAVDVGFGLGPDAFVFVGYDRFWDHDLHRFLLPRERLETVFVRSTIRNGYRVEQGHFFVEGLGRERMETLTHRRQRTQEAERDGGFRGRGEFDRRR
ncbi:MAG: hypothetical protein KGS61_00305 [Verrucomicrobia bacterium]|nr:hypothetical protein [Verrucomicrobiota bacterium]